MTLAHSLDNFVNGLVGVRGLHLSRINRRDPHMSTLAAIDLHDVRHADHTAQFVLIVQDNDLDDFRSFFEVQVTIENYNKLPAHFQEYARRILEIGRRVSFVVQGAQEGFGHAVYCAKEAIGNEGNQVYSDMVDAIEAGKSPQSEEVQAILQRWHSHLRYFYEPTLDITFSTGQQLTFTHLEDDPGSPISARIMPRPKVPPRGSRAMTRCTRRIRSPGMVSGDTRSRPANGSPKHPARSPARSRFSRPASAIAMRTGK